MARLSIRIFPDGKVQGGIQGVQGKKCTNYIKIIEDLVRGRIFSSEFTDEFYEKEIIKQNQGVEDEDTVRIKNDG